MDRSQSSSISRHDAWLRGLSLVFLLLTFWLSNPVRAQVALQAAGIEIGTPAFVADAANTLDPMGASAAGADFQPLQHPLNAGFTPDTYWLRIAVRSRNKEPRRLVLSIENTLLDAADLYVVRATGPPDLIRNGDLIPADQRPYRGSRLLLPFQLAPLEQVTLLLRLQSLTSVIVVPLSVLDDAGLSHLERWTWLLHGSLLGIFLALSLYNLLVYFTTRDRVYLWYALFLPVGFITGTLIDGFAMDTLFPWATWPSNQGLPVVGGLAFVLNLIFTRSFLETRRRPAVDRFLRVTMALAFLIMALPFLVDILTAYQIAETALFIYPMIAVYLGVQALIAGRTEARWYIAGQSASWLGMVTFGLALLDIIPPFEGFTETVIIGLAVDALMLALALGDRIRRIMRERDAAERRAQTNLMVQKAELQELVVARTAALNAALEHAEALALTDTLTGVLNRRGMAEAAQREMARAQRGGGTLCLIMLDLDHFKRINDDFGHAAGDQVIVKAAEAARSASRQSDICARWGGEEFLLLLPETELQQAVVIAERIRAAVAAIELDGAASQPSVSASLGVAELDSAQPDFERLQSQADQALYEAKRLGRNRTEIYRPSGAAEPRSATQS